jgi:hypothetical protein
LESFSQRSAGQESSALSGLEELRQFSDRDRLHRPDVLALIGRLADDFEYCLPLPPLQLYRTGREFMLELLVGVISPVLWREND